MTIGGWAIYVAIVVVLTLLTWLITRGDTPRVPNDEDDRDNENSW